MKIFVSSQCAVLKQLRNKWIQRLSIVKSKEFIFPNLHVYAYRNKIKNKTIKPKLSMQNLGITND
jgi:hypothetical protein